MPLTLNSLCFRYQKNAPPVVNGFSAQFSKGCITALTGRNGVGKTTLCRIIMGILRPESGRVLLDGTDMAGWTLAERGKRIGYAMQHPSRQIFSPTVREEVEYGLHNLNLSPQEIEARRLRFLSLFDLSGFEERFPFSLSQGERQRLVLASILSMQPDYLLLDEPTVGLDWDRKQALGQYLVQIREETDCGIVLISHDFDFIEAYAQNTIHMGGTGDVSSGTP